MKLIKTLLILLFSVGVSNGLYGQEFSQNYWHKGEVHLNTGSEETLRGKLKYNFESDQIQLVVGDNRIRTFHASQLSYVEFRDALERQLRYFFGLPIAVEQNYMRTQLFELLIEGELSLLSREKIVTRTQQVFDPMMTFSRPITTQVLQEDYYLADAKGNIKKVEDRKSSPSWTAFPDLQKEMKEYIESRNINITYREDMKMLVEHYNSLKIEN